MKTTDEDVDCTGQIWRFSIKAPARQGKIMFLVFLLDKDGSLCLPFLHMIQCGLHSIFLLSTAPPGYKVSLLGPILLCREKVESDDGDKVLKMACSGKSSLFYNKLANDIRKTERTVERYHYSETK